MMQKKILLIAGEVSGDSHAAEVIKYLIKKDPTLKFYGIGGDALKNLGMEIFYHVKQMAFLGIGEVIRHLPFIHKVHKDIVNWADAERPVCAILVDYPGFNLKLAKSLKKLSIPVVYYISPQLWAWGLGRVKKIKKYVDKIIVLFPFEKKFYEGHGIKAEYAGHPLVDKHYRYVQNTENKRAVNKVKIGLLPGSRKQEVSVLLPKMIETARQLIHKGKIHSAEIIKVDHIADEIYSNNLESNDTAIIIVQRPLNECLPSYDAVIVASGTATLECGYYRVPMLIVYHVNPLTYNLGKMLIKLDNIGLVNIVAEKQVAKELIQHNFSVKKATEEMERLLDKQNNDQSRRELAIISEKLGQPGAAERTGDFILDFIDEK